MDKVKRLNKIKSCILDMNNSSSFEYRDICKKHEVSVHVFTALKNNSTVVKVPGVKGYQYMWSGASALPRLDFLADYCYTFAQEKIKESQERVARRTPEQAAVVKQRSDERKAAKEKAKESETAQSTMLLGTIVVPTGTVPSVFSQVALPPEKEKRFSVLDVVKIYNDIIRFGITEVEEYIKTR